MHEGQLSADNPSIMAMSSAPLRGSRSKLTDGSEISAALVTVLR
jgi:hypothetical protein